MYNHFTPVLMETGERFRRFWKLRPFDDRGILDVTQEGLVFRGGKHVMQMRSVQHIQLVRQPLKWSTYISVVLFQLSLYLIALLVAVLAGLSDILMIAQGLGFTLIIFGLGGVFLLILLDLNSKWILIDYSDDYGLQQRAYVADGSPWGNWDGSTKRMYQILNHSLAALR
ncbi:MAG: hypothetical protein MI924_08880 [Chloroflexales bacterium]|nr:hypothetical protein [Chloroflexales bacterium]